MPFLYCLVQLPRLNRGSEGVKRSQLVSASVMQIFQAPSSAGGALVDKGFCSCVVLPVNIGVSLL